MKWIVIAGGARRVCAVAVPSPRPRRARRRRRRPGSSSSASTCRRRASGTDGRPGTTIKNPTGFEYACSQAIAKAAGHLEGRVPALAVRRPLLAGSEEVRLRVRGGRRSRRSGRRSSASRPRTSTRTRAFSSQGASRSRRRVADLKSLQTCAQKDTTGLTLHPAQAATREEAARLLGVVDGGVRRRRGRALRRADPRRADHRLAEQEEAGRVRRRRRPDRHERVLRRSDGEGQQAEALRRPGDQEAEGQRDDRQADFRSGSATTGTRFRSEDRRR